MIHNWPDEKRILAEGFTSADYGYVVTESPPEPCRPDLCGVGWCDCRSQTLCEHVDEEPWRIDQEPVLPSEPRIPDVRDCQKSATVTSREHGKVGVKRTHVFPDGSTYTGDWKEEERTGHGVQVWRDGARYEGEWLAGNAHGQGRFMHPNGDFYEGNWMLDRAHGFGSYTHKDRSMYQGNWSHDLQDGPGVETWSDGGRYEGDYKGGLKHGVGKLSWNDGSIYQGQFRQNSIHGNGIYSWADGRRYVGQWNNNRMHGRGQFSWADGRCYAGEYADDVKHGVGMLQSADGRIFAGCWSNGHLAVGGKDVAVEADEREPHPDGRMKDTHLSGFDGHVPASNDEHQLQDKSLPPGWKAALRQLITEERTALAEDTALSPRKGVALGLESNSSVETTLAGTNCGSKAVQIGPRAPGSAASLRHGLSFGECPEQKSLYSRISTVQAAAQHHDAKNQFNSCCALPIPHGDQGAAAGVPPWVSSES